MNAKRINDYDIGHLIIVYIIITLNPLDNKNMHIYPPRCPSKSLIHNSRESAICILVILNSILVVTIK